MNLRPLTCSLLTCLLSLGMMVPRAASAAEDAPRVSRYSLLSEPEAAELPDSKTKALPERPSRGVRILAEVGAGVGTALGLGLATAVVGHGVCQGLDLDTSDFLPCLSGPLMAGAAAAALGFPLGVWWGGEALSGDGRLWAAMLGTGLGLLVGLPLVSERGFEVAPLVLGTVGGIVGYELSQREAPVALAAARPRFQPLVSVSGKGALLGLGGRF